MRGMVLAKQAIDPEAPQASFKVDEPRKRVVPPSGMPPVLNGFDEQAGEAALRLKASLGAINGDKGSNIFKGARFGAVGDWDQILPSFIRTVKELHKE